MGWGRGGGGVLGGWWGWGGTGGEWGWLAVALAAVRGCVVVCTANHWWLDGSVAVGVLVVCAWLTYAVFAAWAALRPRTEVAVPVPETAGLA